ncbi:MarR family winged helix-turn-helix transcriptional regulator [Kribbella sp. NPDC004536]|uniref:MarR family winged helix-turn-helix transcriptional regulator n=1 Tax=Kribbella sp. NPDC004536 TaxID=3364106 RepID=UPI0036C69857
MITPSANQAAADVRVVFGRVKRRLKELAETDDLTPSQSSVLSRLDRDGPASASELATAERIRPQSVAAILSALREAGLIQRQPDPSDGRRQVVSLTTAGRHRLHGDRKVRQEWLAQTLQEQCTEAERQTIIKALALLDHAIEAATGR